MPAACNRSANRLTGPRQSKHDATSAYNVSLTSATVDTAKPTHGKVRRAGMKRRFGCYEVARLEQLGLASDPIPV